MIAKDSYVPGRPAPLPPSALRSCGAPGAAGSRGTAGARPATSRGCGVPVCRAGKVPPPSQKNFPPRATRLRCRAPAAAERGGKDLPPAPLPAPLPAPEGPAAHLGGCGAGSPEPMAAARRAGCGGRRRAHNRGGVGSGAGRGAGESRATPCGGRKVSPAAPGKGISSLVL